AIGLPALVSGVTISSGEGDVQLSVGRDGAPDISASRARAGIVKLGVDADGSPSFGMLDKGRQLRALMGADPDGRFIMSLFGIDQKPGLSLAAWPDGTARFEVDNNEPHPAFPWVVG